MIGGLFLGLALGVGCMILLLLLAESKHPMDVLFAIVFGLVLAMLAAQRF